MACSGELESACNSASSRAASAVRTASWARRSQFANALRQTGVAGRAKSRAMAARFFQGGECVVGLPVPQEAFRQIQHLLAHVGPVCRPPLAGQLEVLPQQLLRWAELSPRQAQLGANGKAHEHFLVPDLVDFVRGRANCPSAWRSKARTP